MKINNNKNIKKSSLRISSFILDFSLPSTCKSVKMCELRCQTRKHTPSLAVNLLNPPQFASLMSYAKRRDFIGYHKLRSLPSCRQLNVNAYPSGAG